MADLKHFVWYENKIIDHLYDLFKRRKTPLNK